MAEKPVVSAVTTDGSEWTKLEWEDEGAQFLQTLDQPTSKKQTEINQLESPTSPSDTSDMPEHTICNSQRKSHKERNLYKILRMPCLWVSVLIVHCLFFDFPYPMNAVTSSSICKVLLACPSCSTHLPQHQFDI